MISFCQFGAGRIGAIHAANIASHPDARLRIVADPDRAAAERLAGRYGAAVGSQAEALGDPAVNAGYFTFEIAPWRSFPGDGLPNK